jgi:hypothetical protein
LFVGFIATNDEKSIADVRIWAEEHVEALNHALRT